jgi:hypothetical protein
MGTVCAFVDFAIATLFVALALPLALRKVRMNIWYGLRIPQAYLSNESWYDINEYGGKQMLLWSLPAVVAGICCSVVPIRGSGPVHDDGCACASDRRSADLRCTDANHSDDQVRGETVSRLFLRNTQEHV